MKSASSGWWNRHGWTLVILLTAFGFSMAVRTIWAYPIISQWGPLFTYGGGSDSYYHSRVMTYIILNHRNLIFDPLLNFPVGAINPREPLFDWMNAILGLVFAPFFGGNAVSAGAWFLDLQAPLWAALGVFPVYLIGKEVSDRRMGLIAALIFPFLSGNIDSSIFGYANYLSFYTFIILVVIYSYIRTVKAAGSRRWVESYRKPGQYLPALRAFARTERSAVKWAVFTGVSLGTLALAWQGYTYAVVVIAISLVVAMVIERIRRVDSFGLYISTAIVGLVGFPMAMPYYIVQKQFTTWFDLPLLLFFGALALLLPFLLMRDVPWVFSVPLLVLLVGGGVGLLYLVDPTAYASLITGQGYFVKNLIYSTVAEAQAPSIDQLVLSYGIVTFFLAFVGLAIFLYVLVRGRFKRYHIVFLVFAILSLYLPVSAAKFFLVGSPAFALLPAEVVRRILDVAHYGELRRTTASLSDRRSQFSAFRKAFKPRHVLVMALVVAIVLPNVWVAIDAGIPGNTKSQYGAQVGATLPPWLQLNTSNPSNFYFGAVGGDLDTPNQYDSAGYNWLAQQDTNVPAPDRPALVSWWDYGFQTIDQGDHPSVADNFQHGIDPAGQFLLSQNESQAIGVLTTTLLQAEQKATGLPYLPSSLNRLLAADGLNLTQLHTFLANTSADYTLVVANPQRYLPVDPSTLTDDNAMYLAMEVFLATSLPLSGVAKVYNDVQAYTGWSIRYALADSRLFPFSGTDTGIFYAPADLTGRVIDNAGQPATFFNLSVLGSDGNYYPYGQLPSGVSQVGSPVINYYAPFYDSMIYRIYIGYNGTDIGQSPGIPGLTINSTTAPLEPGWMLQHFQVVYKTAYYCSQPNYQGTCVAENQPEAVALASANNGSADTRALSYFSGGETMLEYYPGQILHGTIQLPGGAPVGGARVTIYDGWGIPHQTVLTAPDGSFSLVLPPGNDTLNITVGALQGLSRAGSLLVKSIPIVVSNAVGLSFNAPALVETFTLSAGSFQGFVYWQNSNSSSFNPPTDTLVPGAQVVFWGSNLTRRTATTDASGSFEIPNVAPGTYNYSILYQGQNYTQSPVTLQAGVSANETVGLKPASIHGKAFGSDGKPLGGATVTLSGASGVLSTNTSASDGTFRLGSAGPGNYTVLATVPGTDLRSTGVPVTVTSAASNLSVNVTLRDVGSSVLVVTANGVPVSGVPVRFTPVASFLNASVSPLAALSSASGNSTVLLTTASGSVTAYLPPGTYSEYSTAFLNGQTYAGLGTTTVASGVSSLPEPLALVPASPLSGTVATSGTGGSSAETAVLAYASSGGEVTTWASGGSYSVSLPSGSYSLLALQGSPTDASSVAAAIAGVALSGPTTVALSPVTALRAELQVGASLASGAVYPAAGATVTVTVGSSGPSVPAIADTNGTVAFYFPSSLPLSAGSYCLSSSAFGFVPTTQCDLSPATLSAMTRVSSALSPVAVALTVSGLPSGTTVVVNFTAESPTAVNRSLSGGPTFSFSLPPGVYGVGARAVIGSGTVVYLPPGPLSTTIPLGATISRLSLTLIPQVNASGTLTLPSGVPAANVTVALSSPLLNVSVNGTAYHAGFRAAPGTYSAYVTAKVHGTSYAALSRVTVASNGAISPKLVLSSPASLLSGSIVNSAGSSVPLTAPVSLVAPSGAVAVVNAVNGTFSLSLAPGTTYAAFVNGTTVVQGTNGSYTKSWSSVAGGTCSVGTTGSACSVVVSGVPQPVWVNGTLVASGVPGPPQATLRFLGPFPSQNSTVVTSTNGTFSVPLVPGAYSLLASGTGGAQSLSSLTNVLALPSTASSSLVVSLVPTWVDSIVVTPPAPGAGSIGPVTVTVTNSLGARAVYLNQPVNATLALSLPLGTYLVRAVANGTLGGVPSTASAQSTVTIASGNVGTVLPLAFVETSTVSVSLVGPTGATVMAGSNVSLAFSVRNSGNVPVTVRPVGTPSYWNFSFSFANATLLPGPSGNVVSGEVRFTVPAGTPVAHPSVSIELVSVSTGQVLGQTEPGPDIVVVGYYGLTIGSANVPLRVGSSSAVVPVYLHNTGNVPETIVASIADLVRLEGLGWTANISNANATQVSRMVDAGGNDTITVNLTALSSIFVPPQSVTISATVVDAVGGVSATATIAVPIASVGARTTNGIPPVVVSGPSLGTAPNLPPDWLVPLLSFVPVIALVAGVLTYRWWRTRRWTRR